MSDIFIERRKNPARKKQIDLAYQVVWNPQRQNYEVHRAGAPTGGSSRSRDTAIAQAIRKAQVEAGTGTRVAVYATREGKQTAEWTSWS
ncbi:MAG TPA: hypothetical protein VJ798_01105 [Rhizomicrobium sp.]|nr:hypothetical protein [Rhizomicrobium sp.]